MNKDKATREAERSRRLVLVPLTGLLIVCGVAGGLWYQQRQANIGNYSTASHQEDPEVATARREAAIAKAKDLRAKWRSWALQHEGELTRLKRAQPGDQAALMAVWNATPATAANGGISSEDLNGGATPFTWQPVTKMKSMPITDPKLQEAESHEKRFSAKQLQKGFAAYRDIQISSSMMPGTSSISLWASGRVTETKIIPNPHPGHGKPSFVEEPPKEVVLPYDFLQ